MGSTETDRQTDRRHHSVQGLIRQTVTLISIMVLNCWCWSCVITECIKGKALCPAPSLQLAWPLPNRPASARQACTRTVAQYRPTKQRIIYKLSVYTYMHKCSSAIHTGKPYTIFSRSTCRPQAIYDVCDLTFFLFLLVLILPLLFKHFVYLHLIIEILSLCMGAPYLLMWQCCH